MPLSGSAIASDLRKHCTPLILAVGLLLPCVTSTASAGYGKDERKSCAVFTRYKLTARLWYWKGFSQSKYHCPGGCSDKGCTFAEINETWLNQSNPSEVYASIQYRIGTGAYGPHTTTLNKYYHAGNAFTPPQVDLSDDSLGVARSSLNAVVGFADSPGTTTITLTGFSGSLSAKTGTAFGSLFRCVIWNSTSSTDTLVRPSTVLADGSVRIENGQVVTTGFLTAADFTSSFGMDSSGHPVLIVQPVPGLSRTLVLPVDNSGNTVAVSTYGEVGYGTYNSAFIFAPNDPPGFLLPSVGRWGTALLAALLALAAMAGFARRHWRAPVA